MKLIGYTCTYNEEALIPYVMPYIEAIGYDRFIVYDNGSTDRTVEILSTYPFIEIRHYDSDGKFDDIVKAKVQTEAYKECLELAKEDRIWFSFTDFDEVLFFNNENPFKDMFFSLSLTYGYNCYFKRMVNLLPPKGVDSPIELMHDGQMVHTLEGMRGCFWTGGGMKPLLILVNDFPKVSFVGGNHYAITHGEGNNEIKPYNDTSELQAFHLKFVDKLVSKARRKSFAERGRDRYINLYENADAMFEKMFGSSFPLENYFLMDGILSKGCRDGVFWEGLRNTDWRF